MDFDVKRMPQLLDKKGAATFLAVSERTIDRERGKGNLKWVMVGAQVRFHPKHLAEYLYRNTKGVQTR
jgi:cellobiose-specific phosphotransferase system component IIB